MSYRNPLHGLDSNGEPVESPRRFELYELDERSGRWVATASGSRADMEAARDRKRHSAERFDMGGEFEVAPAGQPPASRTAGTQPKPARTEYDGVTLPDGSSHPLRGVPQDVLNAAREALRGSVIYPLIPGRYPERDLMGDPELDGDLESIADGIVAAIRATGWAARSSGLADLGLTNNLVLARRALKRLADPEPFTGSTAPEVSNTADELAERRDYAHRALMGERVDLKETPRG